MSKKIAYCAILMALAMILSYVEVLIPVNIGIPGVKLGLANLVVVIGLYLLKPSEVFLISMGRILLSGFLFGTGLSVLYSLAGGILSFAAMLLLYHTGKPKKGFSSIGVSVAGGVAHNLGQLFVAAAVVENLKIFVYLPVLVLSGTITGFLIGIIAERLLHYLRRHRISVGK